MKPESQNKILIVDDTLSIIDLLKDILLSEGYQVYIATSGEKALQIAENILPDLILLDILMPGIDGYQTCLQLKSKEALKNVPIIIMSALHESFDKVKAFNAGASDYICKPIETEELFARIGTHLKLYATQKQLLNTNATLEQKVEDRTQELLLAKEKAEESDRLKSAFLANISHEIRTPLNGILGFSELICSSDLTQDKRQEYIQTIAECSEQLLKTVSDILDLSKLQAHIHKLEKKLVHINPIIEKVIDIFKTQSDQKSLHLEIDARSKISDLTCYTDEGKLKQALSILVENAVKFTENGAITIGYVLKEPFIEFFVKDTGVGIPEHLLSKIFENFRQVENDFSRIHGGTGIGLAICKGLVELLGGTIEARSKTGEGTIFYFTIKYEKVSESPKKIDYAGTAARTKDHKFNILVAEDEAANFMYISELFSIMDNVEIHHAENGLEAVKMALENENVDLVLMDIKMPELDGMQAMIEIKKQKPALPIIALTAYASEEDRFKFLSAGFDNYFSKPVKSSELLAFIRTYNV